MVYKLPILWKGYWLGTIMEVPYGIIRLVNSIDWFCGNVYWWYGIMFSWCIDCMLGYTDSIGVYEGM